MILSVPWGRKYRYFCETLHNDSWAQMIIFVKVCQGSLVLRNFNTTMHNMVKITQFIIISPKFEISGILWFWSGRRLRRRRLRRRRRRRTPRLVFHVTATPMRVSNSYLTQPLIPQSGRTLSILEKIGKPKWPPNGHFVKI